MANGRSIIGSAILLGAIFANATPAFAVEKYIGEVFVSASTFCPRGTMEAKGQLLQISSNTALFSLLGTQYGGDGRTTFALPDLRPKNQNGDPHNFESLRYCLVTEGVYPARS